MYRLLGFPSPNTTKVIYVLEELNVDYEYQFIDLMKGENKEEDFLQLSPFGKTPTLQHDDDSLFESGAICRYLANIENSPLYPQNKLQRAKVDQWMDFFSCHIGKWLATLYFENVIKEKAGMGDPDKEKCEEAEKFSHQQLTVINELLKNNEFLTGNTLTIADLFAFAYIEHVHLCKISLENYAHVKSWSDRIEQRASIQNGRKKTQS